MFSDIQTEFLNIDKSNIYTEFSRYDEKYASNNQERIHILGEILKNK